VIRTVFVRLAGGAIVLLLCSAERFSEVFVVRLGIVVATVISPPSEVGWFEVRPHHMRAWSQVGLNTALPAGKTPYVWPSSEAYGHGRVMAVIARGRIASCQ
jgi:hypothetical protein